MALQDLTGVGQGGAGLQDKLPKAVKELQGARQVVVAGAAANTNIALTGIAVGDHVASVVNLTDNSNVTEAPVITAGNIKFPTVSTAAKNLLILWYKKG